MGKATAFVAAFISALVPALVAAPVAAFVVALTAAFVMVLAAIGIAARFMIFVLVFGLSLVFAVAIFDLFPFRTVMALSCSDGGCLRHSFYTVSPARVMDGFDFHRFSQYFSL